MAREEKEVGIERMSEKEDSKGKEVDIEKRKRKREIINVLYYNNNDNNNIATTDFSCRIYKRL